MAVLKPLIQTLQILCALQSFTNLPDIAWACKCHTWGNQKDLLAVTLGLQAEAKAQTDQQLVSLENHRDDLSVPRLKTA
jgi:hypothetical protein